MKSLIDLLSLGPIATGICGTSPSFIFYSKGVLDDETCCTVQNHAILIVGFGKRKYSINFFFVSHSVILL